MRYTDFRAAIGTGTLMLVFVLAVVTGSLAVSRCIG